MYLCMQIMNVRDKQGTAVLAGIVDMKQVSMCTRRSSSGTHGRTTSSANYCCCALAALNVAICLLACLER